MTDPSTAVTAQAISAALARVDAQRARRAGDAALQARVDAVKQYQQRRFEHTYADLLAAPRYAGAARFFLDELYGAQDFSRRDAQFARIVPALVRLFPVDIVDTVLRLAGLHALTEELDTAMAGQLAATFPANGAAGSSPFTDAAYAEAWRAVGRRDEREAQIAAVLQVGADLDRLVQRRMLLHSLRLMRAPAHAAGLGDLQGFLERGFATFKAMRGAGEFLACVGQRERELCERLFAGGTPR